VLKAIRDPHLTSLFGRALSNIPVTNPGVWDGREIAGNVKVTFGQFLPKIQRPGAESLAFTKSFHPVKKVLTP